MNKKTKAFIDKEIREANNKYIQEVHREFINNTPLSIEEALGIRKFLEYMLKHD